MTDGVGSLYLFVLVTSCYNNIILLVEFLITAVYKGEMPNFDDGYDLELVSPDSVPGSTDRAARWPGLSLPDRQTTVPYSPLT